MGGLSRWVGCVGGWAVWVGGMSRWVGCLGGWDVWVVCVCEANIEVRCSLR